MNPGRTQIIDWHAVAIACIKAIVSLCVALAAGGAVCAKAWADQPKTLPLLLIVVGFNGDTSHAAVPYDNEYDWGATIFGSGDSLASYYWDMSDNRFAFRPAAETCAFDGDMVSNQADREGDGVVHVTLDRVHDGWGLVNQSSAMAQEFGEVVLDAFRAASDYVDYASYDRNGDGLITPDELAIGVCIAGYDASPFENPGRTDIPAMWPHAGYLTHGGTANEIIGGVQFASYIAISEYLWLEGAAADDVQQEPLGILYHELGHYLGLPDLYPTDADGGRDASGTWADYRVGMLSLMDNGGWAEIGTGDMPRYKPTAFDAWSRYVLGWEMPRIATRDGDYEVCSQLSDNGFKSLLIPTRDPDQFYLIENRQPEGHDESFAQTFGTGPSQGGIVVWLVDKTAYRHYAAANETNDTSHHPGVMELFLETDGSRYTTDWSVGRPLVDQPFYSRALCADVFGDADFAITLPLYGDAEGAADVPSARTYSDVTISFPSDSSREMTVHVEFGDEVIASSASDYGTDAPDTESEAFGMTPAGRIACAALLDETQADVAFVDAKSVEAGIEKGELTYDDVARVLSGSSSVQCFNLTGEQILELVNQSFADNAASRIERWVTGGRAARAGQVLNFGGLSCVVGSKEGGAAHVTSASLLGDDLKPDQLYRVAATSTLAAAHPMLSSSNQELEVLYGSAADALRSFVLQPAWEKAAQELHGTQVYQAPLRQRANPVGSGADAGKAEGGVFQVPLTLVAVGIAALVLLLLGALVTIKLRN